MHDAQEFELDALISGDENDSQEELRDAEKGTARRRGNSGPSRTEDGSESSNSVRDEGKVRL